MSDQTPTTHGMPSSPDPNASGGNAPTDGPSYRDFGGGLTAHIAPGDVKGWQWVVIKDDISMAAGVAEDKLVAESAANGAAAQLLTPSQKAASPTVEPDYPQQVASTATPAAPIDVAESLTKLVALRDAGVLTDEEFAAQKNKLLA